MLIESVDVDIQRKGIYLGQRQVIVKFAFSNVVSPYNDISSAGKEYSGEELLNELKEKAGKKTEMISFEGGEPLLQVDYFKDILSELNFPLYLETNATLTAAIAEVKENVEMFSLEFIPAYQKEFLKSLEVISDKDYYVRLVITKEITAADIDKYAKQISAFNDKTILVLEPLFGTKNYLSMQAMAMRHLKDVRVIPRLHV